MAEQATFSLSQAAKATGKSKSVISKAIKDGTLSAKKANNAFSIEAAELFRVFPRKSEPDVLERTNNRSRTSENAQENSGLSADLQELREKLIAAETRNEMTERERDGLVDQIEDLRRRLDEERSERAAINKQLQTLLIEDRTAKKEPKPRPTFFARMLGAA